MWIKIAEGVSLSELSQVIADRELKKGTPVRFEMTLNLPLAHAFDLAGAEQLFGTIMPEGLIVQDVYSPDNTYQVVIDAEADPVHVAAIVAWVKAHWVLCSLIAIGLTFTLGFIVGSITVTVFIKPEEFKWWIIAAAAALVLVVYFVTKAGIKTPTVAIGGGG